MKLNYKYNFICLSILFSLGLSVCANAEETADQPTGSLVEQIKERASNVSAVVIPKITQYAKELGKAAVCNPVMVRKNHDQLVQTTQQILVRTKQLIKLTVEAFSEKTVTENVIAAETKDIQSLKKNGFSIASKEVLKHGVRTAIFGIKKLVPHLRKCEFDELQFPEEIMSKLNEFEVRLDALDSLLASPNWAVPAIVEGSLSAGVKNNMKSLLINVLEMQTKSVELHEKVVAYLTVSNQQSLEDLNSELEEIKKQSGN